MLKCFGVDVERCMSLNQRLRVLLLEDEPRDAELIRHELRQAGFDLDWTIVQHRAAYVDALASPIDIILADFNVRDIQAPEALQLARARQGDVPFIVVSGSIGEEIAIDLLNSGAADYLLKDRLSRLGRAVQRALEERRLRGAKREAEQALIQAEERMRFAVEAANVGIWEADVPGDTIRVSRMLEQLHGLPPGGFGGTYEAFLALVEPEDRPTVSAAIGRAWRDRRDATSIVYRTRWADGSVHWINVTGRNVYDDSGAPVRAAGIGLDVTERVRLEEQYRQSQKMEAVGQLAGGIAHDFNNLLTAIEGYCMLIAESLPADSPHQAHLAEVRRAAGRATALTHQLLAFSRRQILEPRVLDLRESLVTMEPMLKRLIGEHVEIVVRASADAGRVKADPGQIEQVILNLAVNARDAMPKGGRVEFALSSADLRVEDARQGATVVPGRYTLLAVSDTGEGMDAATSARVFEPFFTTKAQGKGTGLGLSTVYGIVKQSGGYIWLDSAPGRGSTFRIYLPRIDQPAQQPAERTAGVSDRGSERILVVEDEESVRQLVQKVLERYGYDVITAATPQEATAIAAGPGHRIDLLISDVVLPQMSGRELADRILPVNPGIRVLFMSGYTDDAIVHHGVLNEGTPFIQKPFSPQALARKVREILP
jgi:two-component system, cell cycle sensor histidine kinase and response regulator CckA